jgi:hypothetical protein
MKNVHLCLMAYFVVLHLISILDTSCSILSRLSPGLNLYLCYVRLTRTSVKEILSKSLFSL